MKITKRQLRKIIKEAVAKAAGQSVWLDIHSYEDQYKGIGKGETLGYVEVRVPEHYDPERGRDKQALTEEGLTYLESKGFELNQYNTFSVVDDVPKPPPVVPLGAN